ncbi:MAG: PIN domain-containing protein [Polyangia bacterium]
MLTVQVLAEVVPGRLQVHGVTRDPDDNHVLACAVEGEVDFVVSDDRKHILPLGEYRSIPIVSLPAFLGMLRWR